MHTWGIKHTNRHPHHHQPHQIFQIFTWLPPLVNYPAPPSAAMKRSWRPSESRADLGDEESSDSDKQGDYTPSPGTRGRGASSEQKAEQR
jgi:hypothetical protein